MRGAVEDRSKLHDAIFTLVEIDGRSFLKPPKC
jgi:hypothetical protein